MNLRPLLKEWHQDNSFNKFTADLESEKSFRALVTGLEGSQRNFFYAAAYNDLKSHLLIVTADSLKAEKIYEDITSFLPEKEVILLPGRDLITGEDMLTLSSDRCERRLAALGATVARKKRLIVAPVNTLLFRMTPSVYWKEMVLYLKKGQIIEQEELIRELVFSGYERMPKVEGKGQFSVRGDIIDIFPPGKDKPLRVDFFHNSIESLRIFDEASQKSLTHLESFEIYPAEETILTSEVKIKGEEKILSELSRVRERLRKSGNTKTAEKLGEKVRQHLSRLSSYKLNESLYGYFPFFYGEGDTFFSYLHKKGVIFIDDPLRITENAHSFFQRSEEMQKELLSTGEGLPGNQSLLWSWRELTEKIKNTNIYFSLFNASDSAVSRNRLFSFNAKKVTNFYGKTDFLKDELGQWKESGAKVFLLAPSKGRGELLLKHLRDNDIEVVDALNSNKLLEEASGGTLTLTSGSINEGFFISSIKTVFITAENLLPRKKKRKRLLKEREGSPLRSYNELNRGDLVVHEHHGIGKYLGIRTLEIDNTKKDYLHVVYAGEDKLFIPVDQIHLIQKYIGSEGKKPKLQRLGGSDWNRLKNRVKASVHDMAKDLLSLYSARESSQKEPSVLNPQWEQDFDSYFPYEETPDQLRSIEEVRKDLTGSRPMDRLLCGDVGYGKTEVAMRGAFNVVMAGKQAAILSPTTILAQQHLRNFRERFSAFPVEIAMLSRFVSAEKQRETIKKIREGEVDIVIGTHRLISKDVKFKNLGLVVVDEEHRFGVRHKEKLKKLKVNADVLTLTATPIPRTLHMSLSGVRDLSIMETPPENRYPVQTYVLEYSPQVVREAIAKELERKGQVYYVFNRVQKIEARAELLRKLIPEARIAVAHGQMDERELEKIMNDFADGEYDVLLSTTIIEAGLDIPNVNTLIVFDADRFGLAQLYQLRGRVGRSNRSAYAYLTFQHNKMLTEGAEKRLQAIKEFAELGSGFKIAMRDLEIRGAGNILGPEQHGFMADVGFEMYCRLLDEAVKEVKGEKAPEEIITKLDFDISAFIPNCYISDQEQKIEIYQRIYTAGKKEEAEEIRSEVKDRFGELPAEVHNLLTLAQIRVSAAEKGIVSISDEKGRVTIIFSENNREYAVNLYRILAEYPGEVSFKDHKEAIITVSPEKDSGDIIEINQLAESLKREM